MGRRDGMDDYEFERRSDQYNERRGTDPGGGGIWSDDLFSDLLVVVFSAVIVCAMVWFGAGWVDGKFGWSLQPWLKGLFTWFASAVGSVGK